MLFMHYKVWVAMFINPTLLVHIQTVARINTTHKVLSVQLKPPYAHIELDISCEKATEFKQWLG